MQSQAKYATMLPKKLAEDEEDGQPLGMDLADLELTNLLAATSTRQSSPDITPLTIPLAPTDDLLPTITKPPATLTLLSSISLFVGCIIGSGAFASPGPVFARVGSVIAAIFVWVITGILASLGAACYAELGCALPMSGGEPVYLERAFGEMFAFLYEWCAVTIVKVNLFISISELPSFLL